MLARRFNTSLEQVCHRLATLNAPHMRGIPFLFVLVDDAGNISKRRAASGMQFATHGGTYPKWAVHRAFGAPEKILAQAVELLGEQKFFTLPAQLSHSGRRQLSRRSNLPSHSCELLHARDVIYADHMDVSKPK